MHDRQHQTTLAANVARSRFEEEKAAPQMDSAVAF
jgi:hypothetical protein